MKIKYDMQLIGLMDAFSRVTHAALKDCFIDGSVLYYIVEENQIGKAIGKSGANAKKLEKMLNRKIKIVEFNSVIGQFIKNLVYPLKISSIEEESGVIKIEAADSKTRGMLIGRAAQNLRNYESIAKRYFDIKELKVN